MTLVERVAQWPEQWRREGMAEGRRQGVAEGREQGVAEEREQGLARARALLHRLAAVRFGDATGDQLGLELAATDDADLIEAVGELIVRAESGSDLVDGVAELLRRSH